MTKRKSIALDFYCINEKPCKAAFCIYGADICPYLRAKLFDPQMNEKLKHGVKSGIAVEKAIAEAVAESRKKTK